MSKSFIPGCLFLVAAFFLANITTASAQLDSAAIAKRKKRPKPIFRELSVGARLNTDGWALFVDRGTVKSEERNSDYFYDIRLWQLEFSEKKHPQETKRTSIGNVSPDQLRPFIFGKLNNVYTLKIGYGHREMIAGKPDPGSVAIHWVYVGGLALGMEKPYYYDGILDNGTTVESGVFRITDTTDRLLTASAAPGFTTNQSRIFGSAGFTEGLSEIQFVPGVHAKTGLHFDFAASKKLKLAVETGLGVEYYIRPLELMAFKDHVPYFVNAYLSIQAGKRWSKKSKSSRYRR